MYQVLARKWRPQDFGQLVGQPQVSRTLGNAISSDRLAHAYVFAGLRGTGKTTVARILAKCLNCEKGPTPTPCGECVACSEIAESRAMDVLELDAASRTGIDDIRELQEMISYSPARDRFKLLILDEVHMLSTKAFNALLKTLEEPPDNVIFVLATTELHRIPTTILSRCQVFEFRRVTASEVAGHLRKICSAEKIEISDASLDRIARAGEGSVRDALSLLERALAFCGQQIADDEVLRMLGAVNTQVLVDFVEALARRDAGGMLRVLDGLIDEGHDLIHFWNELVTATRDLLLTQTLPDRGDLLARSPEEAQALGAAAEGLSRADLSRAFQILADLEPGLKTSSQPQFLFEATLIRLADLGSVKPIEEILATLGGAPGNAKAPARAPRPPATAPQKKKAPAADAAPALTAEPRKPPPAAPPAPNPGGSRETEIVAALRAERPMIAAMLEQADLRLQDDGLEIRLPAGMDIVARQLERTDNLESLEQAAARICGSRVKARIVTGAPAAAEPGSQTATHGQKAADAPVPKRDGDGSAQPPGLLEQARKEPGIRSLLDTFGAQVVEISPLEPSHSRKPRPKGAGPVEETP